MEKNKMIFLRLLPDSRKISYSQPLANTSAICIIFIGNVLGNVAIRLHEVAVVCIDCGFVNPL